MKTTGIIAEYNPFHNGHKYHLQKAREMTGSDYLVVVMSGDYTQRGTPAIYSKYMRAKTALLAGADLALEMPVFGSVASAPDFAECGVRTLDMTGLCDHLFFGSESGNIDALFDQADAFSTESKEISDKIKAGLKMGLSWPDARANAYKDTEAVPVVSSPNDILGTEYIRALRKFQSAITPVTMKRSDPGYHSEEKSDSFASATAARKAILAHDMTFLQEVLPDELFQCLSEEACPPVTFDDCSLLLLEKLLCSTLEDLLNIAAMPEDLARKLFKNKLDFLSAESLVAERKDRNYTYSRVNRCLMNLMLGITKEETTQFKSFDSAPWIRILGFRRDAGPLLSELKKNAKIPVITKMANAPSLLSEDILPLFEKHVQTSEIYRLLCQLKTNRPMKNEYTRSVIII